MTRPEVVARSDDGVLRVTINRPQKRNALSRSVLQALREAFDRHAEDDTLRLAVLTSAGEKSFAAGGDLREVASIRTIEGAARFAEESCAALDSIRRFPLPVVAAVNGDALGGGSELAVACDMRILAAHARIGFIQGRLNVSTAWGGGPDLMRLVGYGRALSLLTRSAMVGGDEALALGVADAVAPAGEPFAAFVDRFIEPMRQQSPMVMRGFKAQALLERLGAPLEERRRSERHFFSRSWVHDDHWAVADKLLASSK
ncbi:MAG: enoyl-CoA hydratase/isomerase family protein [Pseudomonadota bacterium]|nr:enoyl-CoA hydratase/isomerase family protein [Pseudomonadota bacterium]